MRCVVLLPLLRSAFIGNDMAITESSGAQVPSENAAAISVWWGNQYVEEVEV